MVRTNLKTALWQAVLLALLIVSMTSLVVAENVTCDPSVDTSIYYCRGWQDGVGPFGSRVHFIARMMGDDPGDDFGDKIVPLGDINGDGRGDFMVWVKNKCEWRIYHGDSLISKTPAMVWPRGDPPYPCSPYPGNFALVPDITGDGQPDLFRLSAGFPPKVWIYSAGSDFDTLPELTLPDSDFVFPGAAGSAIAGGFDLNGDSQPDFAIGDPDYYQASPRRSGRVYVYWGGAALDSIPDLVFTDTSSFGSNQLVPIGAPIAVMPALNGDSYADLIFGRPSANLVAKDPPGMVAVFYGGQPMDTALDLYFEGPDTAYWSDPHCGYLPANYFGGVTCDVGDVNQDGYDDLLVSGYGCVPGYIYYGGPGFDPVVDLRMSSSWPGEQDGNITGAARLGDVDGDGHTDFCTVTLGNEILGGWVRIHFSRPSPTGAADWVIAGDDWFFTASRFGRSTTSVGDVNGDGFDDIAIGMETGYNDEDNEGGVYIFAGYNPDIYSGILDDPEAPIPSDHRLVDQIAPNPFNSATTIRLAESFEAGTIVVYDILGRSVRVFRVTAGGSGRDVLWDGRDERGAALASGLYFARASNGRRSETHKLLLLK